MFQSVLISLMACYGVMFLPLVNLGYSNAQVATVPSILMGFTNLLGTSCVSAVPHSAGDALKY